eukprot:m.248385 g.248385  ORF g.248385 m.248385 type:complete len:125 (+) comp40287_c0_seq37:390-764(+)
MALANAVELSFQLSCSRFAFIDSMHNKAASSKEDSEYIRYAVGLVSEYLPPEWTDRMKDEFKEHFDKEVHDEPVSKKAKRGSQSEECDDDYTKFNTKKTLEVEKLIDSTFIITLFISTHFSLRK